MSDGLNLFILAGEASGDRIAADLVARLRQRTSVTLTGVGGAELEAQGLSSIFPMEDLAVMGLVDVLRRLPLLLRRVRRTATAIMDAQPDVVVLVDAQEFSRLVARRLQRLGFRGAVILYVAPSVWARSPGRAARLLPLFDEVLAVLPFEPKVMQDLGGPPTSYVGHPALSELGGCVRITKPTRIALLPGSRSGELRRHLPVFRNAATDLLRRNDELSLYIPTLPSLAARLEAETRNWAVKVDIVADRTRRTELYAETRLALCAAGTATLELALADVPMLIVYVMDGPQAHIYRRLRQPTVGLPNILLSRKVAPELVMAKPDAEPVSMALAELTANEDALAAQISAWQGMRRLMEEGTAGWPRQDPAERVLAHARKAR